MIIHFMTYLAVSCLIKLTSSESSTITNENCLSILGRIAQSVTCLATDASLTADPGVASSIPAWSHTFVEIDQLC